MCSRPFETRSLPSSLAATVAALPSMSLFPKAPFDLSICPSMSLASRRLHSRAGAFGVDGHVGNTPLIRLRHLLAMVTTAGIHTHRTKCFIDDDAFGTAS